MATLTIGKLDDPLKSRLRMRAAALKRSIDEQTRPMLGASLQEPRAPAQRRQR